MKTLLDSGGSHTVIQQRALPKGCVPTTSKVNLTTQTTSGIVNLNQYVTLRKITLPEFDRSTSIDHIKAFIINQPHCPHDIIAGRDFLSLAQVSINFNNYTTTAFDTTINMKPPKYWTIMNTYLTLMREDPIETEYIKDSTNVESHLNKILDSKYEYVNTHQVAQTLTYLSSNEKDSLTQTLDKYPILFNGKLGLFTQNKVHLDLIDNARPFHSKPYAVPHLHLETFKKELDRLVQIGVLSPTGATEWAAGTFIVPKKDGRVRWVSDFRQLNKNIRRRKYPIPRIHDILHRRKGYKYFTKIDISMQYYAFELDDDSKEICTIITPFGKYRYNRLPMGVSQSPDVAQEIMERVLKNLPEIEIYIDDIGIFSDSWKDHIASINKVLSRLQENGFTVNPLKCEWAVKETDWLGYWLTPTGLKPWTKKIRSILSWQIPTTTKQLRSFLGAVNFYRDMWPRRSHILSSLTALTGSKTFRWTDVHTKAFEAMKALIAKDTMCAYPDHNLPFHIYTDASDYQLGSVIVQNKKPIAYYSKKLNPAQQNYTTMEKELLSVVATLKEFRNTLLGAEIHVYTDHRNNVFRNFTSQRVLRWRLLLEDFSPQFHYIKGQDNKIADWCSRVTIDEKITNDKSIGPARFSHDPFTSIIDDLYLSECLLNHPLIEELAYPLDYSVLQIQQFDDYHLQKAHQQNPVRFPIINVGQGKQLIAFQPHISSTPLIAIPDQALKPICQWYHLMLNHVAMPRLYHTIRLNLYHPQLYDQCAQTVNNCQCRLSRLPGKGYGKLPEKQVHMNPFYSVAVDLIGPWNITINGIEYSFHALTMIDPDTNFIEICSIPNKYSKTIANQFENFWLSKYPMPRRCIHDQGTEFTGWPFQNLLQTYNIASVPISVRNPQANSIIERMHQTMATQLRTILHVRETPQNFEEATTLVDTAIASTVFALRSTIHSTMKTTPGALIFHRDMLLNIPFIADLRQIQEHRQHIVHENLRRQNMRRYDYDYCINDMVLRRLKNPAHLQPRFDGPFQVIQVHSNGTLTILLRPNVVQRINIRQLQPVRQLKQKKRRT